MTLYKQAAVGFFVLIGLICVAYLTIKLGRMEIVGKDGYPLIAKFSSISGLRVGAEIEIAGVPIGKVSHIGVDTKNSQAIVTFFLNNEVQLPADTIASVKTSGLIGDKYVNLSTGGSPDMLKPGDEIFDTESVIDIESLISKYAFGEVK